MGPISSSISYNGAWVKRGVAVVVSQRNSLVGCNSQWFQPITLGQILYGQVLQNIDVNVSRLSLNNF